MVDNFYTLEIGLSLVSVIMVVSILSLDVDRPTKDPFISWTRMQAGKSEVDKSVNLRNNSFGLL